MTFSIFVNHLNPTMKNLELHSLFSKYAPVRLAWKSQPHFGYVVFETEDDAMLAMAKVREEIRISGLKPMLMAPYLERHRRFNKLYVSNLGENITESDLKRIFTVSGSVPKVVLPTTKRGYALIFYNDEPYLGLVAIRNLDGTDRFPTGNVWKFAGAALKGREKDLRDPRKFKKQCTTGPEKDNPNKMINML